MCTFAHIFTVASAPTITSLNQMSADAVNVEWNRLFGGAPITGYVVHCSNGSIERNKIVSNSSTSHIIMGLTNGLTYNVSLEATSQHLSGESEDMAITLSECKCIVQECRIKCLHTQYLHWKQ